MKDIELGVAGTIIKSKVAEYEGNSIFLPATGYLKDLSVTYQGINGNYWSATLTDNNAFQAYYTFFSEGYNDWNFTNRYLGLPVRPVYEE